MEYNSKIKSNWHAIKVKRKSFWIIVATLFMCFNPGWARADVYQSTGVLGDLKTTTEKILINTGTTTPTIKIGSKPVQNGRVNNGAAMFDFKTVVITSGTIIEVKGNRPLVLAASEDLECGASFDVSGGLAGGGAGGTPAPRNLIVGQYGEGSFNGGVPGYGGFGGGRGLGGACGGNGGAGTAGEQDFFQYAKLSTAGSFGNAGSAGGAGFNSAPPFANGGAGGAGGVAGERGTPGIGGGGGAGGICVTYSQGNWGYPGEDGGEGGSGKSGGKGVNGTAGQAASIYVSANSLILGSGNGGGGGGAGGSGGGGGAGASGGGGGGGGGNAGGTGYSEEYCCRGAGAICFEHCTRNYYGSFGNLGGRGGYGGRGANGFSGGYGGAGGTGGSGGGCIVLSARGLVSLSSDAVINISASMPQQGNSGEILNLEYDGENGYWGLGSGAAYGGRGGKGGNSVGTADGGTGGRGGYGTPGMLKLHGSVIAGNGAMVMCQNHQAAPVPTGRLGRLSLISNMDGNALANLGIQYSDQISTASVRNSTLLTTTSLYDSSQMVPYMPTLVGGPAAGGKCLPKFYNQDIVVRKAWDGWIPIPGVVTQYHINESLVKMVRLSGIFEGFDQIYVYNVDSRTAKGGRIIVGGNEVVMPTILPEETWVIAVKSGIPVTLRDASIIDDWLAY